MLKYVKKTLKMIGWILLGIVALVVIIAALFINLSPEFGGKATEADKERFRKSGHYEEGIFVNQTPTPMEMGLGKLQTILADYIKGVPNHSPKGEVPILPLDSATIANRADSVMNITWFGHSAFLVEIDGKKLLLDPMLGPTPAPHPMLGKKRYGNPPISIAKLPAIDAVLFSHDHYDHLDYGSVMKLKDKVGAFYVPLGLGAHLRAWGVPDSKIHELNWGEEAVLDSLKFISAPSRHFSGRGLTDRFATLWCSWVIEGTQEKLYFSGDSGYGPHFKEIGAQYGPFDFAMMECGQYDQRWEEIHMMPEQSVQATLDVQAKKAMPIHWGTFTLALHSWTDPIERYQQAAAQHDLTVVTPKVGETFALSGGKLPQVNWWEEVK